MINHMQNEFVAFADLDNALYICSLPTCTAGLRSVTFTGEIGAIAMDEVEQRVVVARGAALNYIDWDDLQVPWSNDGTAGSSSRHNADSDLHIIKTSAGSNIQCVAVDARPGHRLAFYSTGGVSFGAGGSPLASLLLTRHTLAVAGRLCHGSGLDGRHVVDGHDTTDRCGMLIC